MMGPTHRVFGALCGATVAATAGESWTMTAMTAAVAMNTAHGWASPDVDQTGPWVAVRQALPGPLGTLLNHRNLAHWWGLPALAWWGIGTLPTEAQWPAFALLIGWVSHLLGDLIFGDLPVDPWGHWRVGLGLDTNGFIESGRLRGRRVLPGSPLRLVIGAALAYVLFWPAAMSEPAHHWITTVERTLT